MRRLIVFVIAALSMSQAALRRTDPLSTDLGQVVRSVDNAAAAYGRSAFGAQRTAAPYTLADIVNTYNIDPEIWGTYVDGLSATLGIAESVAMPAVVTANYVRLVGQVRNTSASAIVSCFLEGSHNGLTFERLEHSQLFEIQPTATRLFWLQLNGIRWVRMIGIADIDSTVIEIFADRDRFDR